MALMMRNEHVREKFSAATFKPQMNLSHCCCGGGAEKVFLH